MLQDLLVNAYLTSPLSGISGPQSLKARERANHASVIVLSSRQCLRLRNAFKSSVFEAPQLGLDQNPITTSLLLASRGGGGASANHCATMVLSSQSEKKKTHKNKENPRDTGREGQGSTGWCPRNFLLVTIEELRRLQTRPNSHLPAREAPNDQNRHVQIRAPKPSSVCSAQEQTYTKSQSPSWKTPRRRTYSQRGVQIRVGLEPAEELAFLLGHRPGVPRTPSCPGAFQKVVYVIFFLCAFSAPYTRPCSVCGPLPRLW